MSILHMSILRAKQNRAQRFRRARLICQPKLVRRLEIRLQQRVARLVLQRHRSDIRQRYAGRNGRVFATRSQFQGNVSAFVGLQVFNYRAIDREGDRHFRRKRVADEIQHTFDAAFLHRGVDRGGPIGIRCGCARRGLHGRANRRRGR